MRSCLLASLLVAGFSCSATAQAQAPRFEYLRSGEAPPAGTAPGLKATELAPKTRIFHIVFSKGDDVAAGLADFAEKNHLTNAHFTAIGAFGSALIGWADRPRKAFKYVRLDEEMEVASFIGNITRGRDGKPVVHAHCVVGLLRNGAVYAGHCMQERVSLTMQMYLTDSQPLQAGQPPRSPGRRN
jgi:predicted DNA-binding protein with PD1-like motif